MASARSAGRASDGEWRSAAAAGDDLSAQRVIACLARRGRSVAATLVAAMARESIARPRASVWWGANDGSLSKPRTGVVSRRPAKQSAT